ncbi:hypothetical protein NDU88_005569 [Pleurodeles waltl]|uniref:Uncharacterized protein n=1 Tax=Pleurodeles waltl TaxID=8319 RepID=A0AAV7TBE6_PLEWA|nr:hypothetical protein NDU88_005569 [Pleurodeles waltl]
MLRKRARWMAEAGAWGCATLKRNQLNGNHGDDVGLHRQPGAYQCGRRLRGMRFTVVKKSAGCAALTHHVSTLSHP